MSIVYCFHNDHYVDTDIDAEVIYPDGIESAKCSRCQEKDEERDLQAFKSNWGYQYQWSTRGEI